MVKVFLKYWNNAKVPSIIISIQHCTRVLSQYKRQEREIRKCIDWKEDIKCHYSKVIWLCREKYEFTDKLLE